MKVSSSEADSETGIAVVLPGGGRIPNAGRQRISENIPSHELLMAIKHKKKVSQDSYNANTASQEFLKKKGADVA